MSSVFNEVSYVDERQAKNAIQQYYIARSNDKDFFDTIINIEEIKIWEIKKKGFRSIDENWEVSIDEK